MEEYEKSLNACLQAIHGDVKPFSENKVESLPKIPVLFERRKSKRFLFAPENENSDEEQNPTVRRLYQKTNPSRTKSTYLGKKLQVHSDEKKLNRTFTLQLFPVNSPEEEKQSLISFVQEDYSGEDSRKKLDANLNQLI
jgi:hypothetical protein